MGAGKLARGGLISVVLKWASRLRFPYLFAVTAVLFGLNLLIPDAIPMADEVVMGLVALLLAGWKKRGDDGDVEPDAENGTDAQ